MGVYFYLHAVRRVPDPNRDNFFVAEEPQTRYSGVHSSLMEMFFARTAQIDPALSARPRWYSQAFASSGKPVTQENFIEPAEVIRDLERILAEIMARNDHLPAFYRMRRCNKDGIAECIPTTDIDIYYEGEPCSISSSWDGVAIWSRRGKCRDITGIDSFDCILRNRSTAQCEAGAGDEGDGMRGTVSIEKESFFSHMRPYLFGLFVPCDWALRHRLLVFPMWS